MRNSRHLYLNMIKKKEKKESFFARDKIRNVQNNLFLSTRNWSLFLELYPRRFNLEDSQSFLPTIFLYYSITFKLKKNTLYIVYKDETIFVTNRFQRNEEEIARKKKKKK